MLLTLSAYAQQVDTLAFGPASPVSTQAPRVFLDCRSCDQVYFRREIPFVDYVRERQVADIHLLVTRQRTGSGGREFTLTFIGQKRYLGVDQQLAYTSAKGSTSAEERSGLARRMKLGLIPYVSQTAFADQLTIYFTPPEGRLQPSQETDPWKSWVFEIEGEGSIGGEASRQSLSFSAGASADRVTERWKIRTRFYMDYSQRQFEPDDQTTIRSNRESRDVTTSIVYSLGGHWSAGLFGHGYTSTYENIDFGLRLAPALEYSLYPYEESARKELTLAYRMGYQSMNYIEETIFGRTAEALPNESMTATLRMTQPWGSMFIQLQGSHYLPDFSKNRLEFFSNVTIRVFRGLSLRVSGILEIIHDQLYLPRGEGSLEDLLLQRKQQATTYDYRGTIGLSYTFGSIFSNVVNTRL